MQFSLQALIAFTTVACAAIVFPVQAVIGVAAVVFAGFAVCWLIPIEPES